MKKIALLLLLLSLIGGVPAFAQDTTTGQTVVPFLLPDILNRGDSALNNNDTDAAIRDYSLFILLNPTVGAGYFARAQGYADANELDLALADIDRAVPLLVQTDSAAPLNSAVYELRGDIHRHQQNYADAIDDYTQSIGYAPTYTALANRGLLYAQQNQFEKALDDLNQALAQPDSTPGLLIYRGAINLALNDALAAAQDYATFLQAAESNVTDLDAIQSGQGATLPLQRGGSYRIPFTAKQGQYLRALVTTSSGSADPLLVVTDAQGNALVGDDNSSGSSAGGALIYNYVIPANGDYDLLIGYSLGGYNGSVSLRFELGDTPN